MDCLFTIVIRNLFDKIFTNEEEGQARHAKVFFLIQVVKITFSTKKKWKKYHVWI